MAARSFPISRRSLSAYGCGARAAAYYMVQSGHTFNLLDARAPISVTERKPTSAHRNLAKASRRATTTPRPAGFLWLRAIGLRNSARAARA